MKCYLNGDIIPLEAAQLQINDLALLRGFGIFDYFVFQRYQPRFLEDYLNRFFGAIEFLGLDSPLERDEVRTAIHQLIAANEVPDGGIRLSLTGGYSLDGFTPTTGNFFIIQSPFPSVPEEILQNGGRVALYQHQRELPNVKSINYLSGVYLLPWLKERNAHYPLYHDGTYVRESDRSNFFIIDEAGTLITPKDKVLHGITRLKILEVARDLGMRVEERDVELAELKAAREMFFTSSIKGALPIVSIDGQIIGNGQLGEQTQKLQEAFLSLVSTEQVH
ncbi:MAG: aminotransferase class IV [Bacteroidota bacterium]